VARHPWVAAADDGIRWGIQVVLGDGGLDRLREVGRRIEELGFDGCYIFDHPALQADPWNCLAALSSVTERVRLGSVVNCVPYRHPAYLARLAADLDNLSGGRLMLGLGIGWLIPEFAAFDVPFRAARERYQQLEEALAIIPGVWGAEKFSFAGEQYRVSELQIAPPPVQSPRPPLMIGGSGETRTLRLVAQYADACNINEAENVDNRLQNTGGPAAVRRKLEILRGHCEAVGRPYEEILRTHFTIKTVVGPTDAAAEEKLARLLAMPSTSPGTRRAHRSAFVCGSPQTVAAHYRAVAAAGMQYFVVQVDSIDTETLELLASGVAPRVEPAD
jgi:alkanesulfonate monooxygenase SsuD/methylene tetrahydromethanopterin reductase-like flavin-dependent oxidoreductase (luciferase family)